MKGIFQVLVVTLAPSRSERIVDACRQAMPTCFLSSAHDLQQIEHAVDRRAPQVVLAELPLESPAAEALRVRVLGLADDAFLVAVGQAQPGPGFDDSLSSDELVPRVIGRVLRLARAQHLATVRSRGRCEGVLDVTWDAVLVLDPRTLKARQANRAALNLLQVTGDVAAGRPFYTFEVDQTEQRMRALVAPLLNGYAGVLQLESKFRLHDGSVCPVELRIKASDPEASGERSLVVVARSLQGARRAEAAETELRDQLDRALRIQQVGILANGIAHEFNNQLTTITGTIQMALLELPPQSALAEELTIASRAADQAARLSRMLLTLSRSQDFQNQPVDFNALVGRMAGVLRRALPSNIELVFEASDELPTMWADAARIEQALLNLGLNARDAMPQGGRIEISTTIGSLPNPKPGGPEFAAVARVTDTGIGMPPDIVARIFDPFFTTKPVGRGTGLGLPMVRACAFGHGGDVTVTSVLGEGTTFSLFVPIVSCEPARGVDGVNPAVLPGGEETILFVDDVAEVVLVGAKVLEHCGYTVYTANSCARALEMLRARRSEIDLVVSDLVMPSATGVDLARNARARGHHQPLLLITGHSDEAIERAGGTAYFAEVVHKPFSPEQLAQAVRRCLDGGSTSRHPA